MHLISVGIKKKIVHLDDSLQKPFQKDLDALHLALATKYSPLQGPIFLRGRPKVKKQALTLMEVCISLGLMAIVVYTLFSSLLQTVRLSASLETTKKRANEISYCYNRLLPLFSHANPHEITFEKEEDGSLTKISFPFENGLDPAFIFSGIISASLHLDSDHNLILEMTSKDNTQRQTEPLLQNLSSFTLEDHLPFFLTLHLHENDAPSKEFVFFFSDRPLKSEGYAIL